MNYSERLEEALVYAARIHRGQTRRAVHVSEPYLAHLLAVAALVGEEGGDEDQLVAALLHDAAEDAGGRERLEDIRRRFGERVANIVDWCTDSLEFPKPPWRQRKEAHLQRLQNAPADALLVVLADKVHNARSLLRLFRREGVACFQRFRGGQDGTLWYYREMVRLLRRQLPQFDLTDELTRLVEEIHRRLENSPIRFSPHLPQD
ncbi:Bifunctional (p)ppGpp synthase/hydrolase SpoT [bacterium HR36]|nr:Bifunctional (p)ppGpp synthase/hydrolase SpoT [bacterium HR36]